MKKNFITKIITLLALFSISTLNLTGCGSNAEAAGNTTENTTEAVSEANEVADGVDPLTGEAYPDEIKVGILNGSLIDAVAHEEGLYDDFEKETGVKVSILYFESGRDVNNAYASKSLDVATFGSSPISLGTTNKLGYEIIFLNDLIGDSEALAVSADIKTSKDLSGKTIATPFASTSHYSLLNYLKNEGVEDVNVIDLQPQDILAAWQRGDIDGAYVWPPVLAEIQDAGNTLITSAQLAEQGAITADVTTAYIEFAEKYPSLVKEYVNVLVKANDVIINDSEKAKVDGENYLQVSEEKAAAQIAGSIWLTLEDQLNEKYLGTSDGESGLASTVKSTADFHVTQGNLDASLELEEYQSLVDSSFVEALLK